MIIITRVDARRVERACRGGAKHTRHHTTGTSFFLFVNTNEKEKWTLANRKARRKKNVGERCIDATKEEKKKKKRENKKKTNEREGHPSSFSTLRDALSVWLLLLKSLDGTWSHK